MAEQKLVDAKALSDALYEADAITMKGVVIINQFPTVEAKPVVHAHWESKKIMARTPFAKNYYCSNCKDEPLECKHICGNCGAQMDEEINDDQ